MEKARKKRAQGAAIRPAAQTDFSPQPDVDGATYIKTDPVDQSLFSRHFIKNKFLLAILPPGILTLLTFLIYLPSLHYPFQFDDIANISKRFAIRFDNPLGRWWTHSRWLGDWLNSVNFQIGRFDPFYYRFFNVMIHILAGLCVFYLIKVLCSFVRNRPFFYNNATLLAFVSSGLFLLHPVQTQTVSYVIQARIEGLASLLVLATLLSYAYMAKVTSWWAKITLGLCVGFFGILVFGTKEIAVVMPFLIVLMEWFFISQEQWNLFKKRLLIIGAACIASFLVVINYLGWHFIRDILSLHMSTANNRGNILTPNAFDVITPGWFFMSELKVLLHYLLMFIWPLGLSVEYDWKMVSKFLSLEVLFPLVVLVALFVFVARSAWLKKNLAVTFGLLWFVITMAPRTTVIPSPELVCDYKTYLASVGMLFILASAIVYVFNAIFAATRRAIDAFSTYELQLGIVAVFLLSIGLGAYQRNAIWETNVTFWEDNARKAPTKARVHNNLGVALSEAGRIDEALVAYQKAISLDAYYADPLSNIAVAYSMKNDIDKAIEALKSAVHICPNYPEAYNNLGSLFLQKKLYGEAEQSLSIATQLRPYYGKAYYNLARLYEEKGDRNKAWEFLKKATEGDLDIPEVYFKFGQLSIMLNKYQEAEHAFETIVQRGAGQNQVWFNLANAYFMQEKYDKAQAVYERLVKDNPMDGRYIYNLAETHFVKNNVSQACELFKKAASLPQPVGQAFFRAANCLERMDRVDEAKSLLHALLSANAADDFKAAVKTELARITETSLQKKIKSGNGTIKLSELKHELAIHGGLKDDAKAIAKKQVKVS